MLCGQIDLNICIAIVLTAIYCRCLIINRDTPVICYYLDGTESEQTIGQPDAEKAQAVVDSIAKIGTVTKDSKKKIERARQLYNDASAEQREYVTNYEVLTAAEEAYQSLKK